MKPKKAKPAPKRAAPKAAPANVATIDVGKDGHLWAKINGQWLRLVTEIGSYAGRPRTADQ